MCFLLVLTDESSLNEPRTNLQQRIGADPGELGVFAGPPHRVVNYCPKELQFGWDDLTVIATGNQQSGIKYILKPQADESGAENRPANNKDKDKQD